MTRDEALAMVERAGVELARCHREYAMVAAQEKERRTRAYWEADGDSVSARDRWADGVVLDLSLELVKLKGQIAALEAERQLAEFVVIHGAAGG